MRKTISFLLVTAMILAFASCGDDPAKTTAPETVPASTGTETAPATEPETKEPQKTTSAVEPEPTKMVKTIYTKEDIDKIPVANSSMTNDEIREIVVRFMHESNNVQWTPINTRHITLSSKVETFAKDRIYVGMPYNNAVAQSIYAFVDFIDPVTGVLTVENDDQMDTLIGTDCADAVFWAWARVSSTITFADTNNMTKANGVLRVGPYTYPDTVTSLSNYYTSKICSENGKQTMFESYGQVKAGDGFVLYGSGGGHAILAGDNAVLVRNTDGTVDGTKSYIHFIDQNSKENRIKIDGEYMYKLACNEDGTNNKYTFEELYKKNFIPVTCAELQDQTKIEKATASLTNAKPGMTMTEVSKETVNTNYRIAKIIFDVVDKDGNIIYTRNTYGTPKRTYSCLMTSVILKPTVSRLKLTGDEEYVIKVLVSSGETIEIYRAKAVV